MPASRTHRVQRTARLRWVPLAQMIVNPLAQRDFKHERAAKLAEQMDLEQLGTPTCNLRDGTFYIIDGQHRIAGLRMWLGDEWDTQSIQCWCYEGLTEAEEAEVFLKQNDTLAVSTFDKFRVGVQAGREEETDIDRIVRAQGLRISRNLADEGSIIAVGALRQVYRRSPAILAKSLRIIRDSYGTAALRGPVIEGFGLLCHRYDGDIDEAAAVARLARARGGLTTLMNTTETLRLKTGAPVAQCIAASVVETLNRGRGGKKLATWWKTEPAEGEAAA